MVRERIEPDDVKQLRKRLGLTQRALAEALNVTPYVVSNWETGKHRPTGTAASILTSLLSERDGQGESDAPHEGGAGPDDLSIRLLVKTLRWVDEHGAPNTGLVRSLGELAENVRAAVLEIAGTDMEPDDANAAGVAIVVVQHCMKLIAENREEDE